MTNKIIIIYVLIFVFYLLINCIYIIINNIGNFFKFSNFTFYSLIGMKAITINISVVLIIILSVIIFLVITKLIVLILEWGVESE